MQPEDCAANQHNVSLHHIAGPSVPFVTTIRLNTTLSKEGKDIWNIILY